MREVLCAVEVGRYFTNLITSSRSWEEKMRISAYLPSMRGQQEYRSFPMNFSNNVAILPYTEEAASGASYAASVPKRLHK